MITFYKTTDQGLQVVEEICKGCWINVVDPIPQEIEQLRELGVPPEFITYPLDVDERARIEKEDGETLLVLRIPFAQGPAADIPFVTIPLGIVLDNQWILTICKYDNEIIRDFAAGRVRGLATGKRNRFILYLLLHTATRYLSYLREINKTVDHFEDQLLASMRNHALMGLLKYQKSLVYFTTALRANQVMMERLQRGQFFKTYPDDEDLLEDVITENQQAIEMTNIANNILSSMMDAFASIISNNMNVVIKFLAAVTIVLTLPTLISSFYGMNVNLPLAGWQHTAWLILTVSILLAVGVAWIFVKRDWM
jgi:magnesium transporter